MYMYIPIHEYQERYTIDMLSQTCYLVLGKGIPEGRTAYVLTLEENGQAYNLLTKKMAINYINDKVPGILWGL